MVTTPSMAERVDIAWTKWLWVLLLAPLLGGGAAYAISSVQTKTYEATSTILVNQIQSATGAAYSDILANQQLAKTYAMLVVSDPTLDEVAKRVGSTRENLRIAVSASYRTDSQLIDITAQGDSPEKAAQIADETAKAFSDRNRDLKLQQQAQTERDLQSQLRDVQASIAEKEQTLSPLASSGARSELDALRTNLTAIQALIQQVKLDATRGATSITLAVPASRPTAPAKPRVALNSALGAVLGLVVAAAGILIIGQPIRRT